MSQPRLSRRQRSGRRQGYGNENLMDYESFPMGLDRSRSASPDRRQDEMSSPSDDNQDWNESMEDPGNPLGNAVDFCVDSIAIIHAKTKELNCDDSVVCAINPCREKGIDQLIGDLLLCNDPVSKTEESAQNQDGTEDSFVRSSSKRSKNGWKKSMNGVPGKNLLKSMTIKRKRSSPPKDKSDDDDLWTGIIDENEVEVDEIITIGSKEDSLVEILGNPAKSPEVLEAPSTKASADEHTFGDEGIDGGNNAKCEMFFSASSILALPTCCREDTSDQKGDMVIPRDFEKEESMDTRKFESSAETTKSLSKKSLSPYKDADDGEPKMEFEMILDDSRFGKRKWGKIKSLFAPSGNSRSSDGNNRQRGGRSLSSARSVNSLKSEMEVTLDGKVKRKRSFPSKIRGLSSRSRSLPLRKNRISSWKKKPMKSDTGEQNDDPNTDDVVTTADDKISTQDEKAMDPDATGIEDNSIQSSPSDEKSAHTHKDMIKDMSSTAVMGLQEWSWGVFNMDQQEQVDRDDTREDQKSRDGEDDCDSSTYYNQRDGTDSNHDDWIMDEDQLMSFSEEDDSRQTAHSSDYNSTEGSIASCEEDETKKTSSKNFAKRLAFPKSLRKPFGSKKKKREAETDNGKTEAVLQQRQTKETKGSSTVENRDDGPVANTKDTNGNSVSAFSKAKKVWRKRSSSIGSASMKSATNSVSSTRDKITVVTNAKSDDVDSATIDTAANSLVKTRSRGSQYIPDRFKVSLMDANDNGENDDDYRDSASERSVDRSESTYDESSVSSSSVSSDSQSWARDDEDIPSGGFMYGFDLFSSPEVIRE